MGDSTGIGCRNCDYTKEFIIGIGMMYSPSNLISIEDEFALLPHLIKSKKIISYIKKIVNNKNATIIDGYGHDIYRCYSCGEFYGRFFIQFDYEDGSYEPEYRCSKCNDPLKLIDYDIIKQDYRYDTKKMNLKNYPCPKCGEYSLFENYGSLIQWD